MKSTHTPKFFASAGGLFLCVLMLFVTSGQAQSGGTGAKGGSNRPERRERTTVRTRQEPIAQPSPSPSPSPSPAALASPQPSPTPTITERIARVRVEEEPEPEPKAGQDPWTTFFLYGVNVLARPRHEQGTSKKVVGGFALNVYLTRRIFVEIDNDNFVSLKGIVQDRSTSVGDTVLIVGGDALLEKKESRTPNVMLYYGIKVPTASSTKGIGSGEVDHILFGLVSKNFGGQAKKSYAELDFTEYFAGQGGGRFAKTSSLGGVFKRWLVKDKSRLHFEIGGTFATKDSNAEMYTLDYFEYFRGATSVRLGGRFGLTPNVPRAGFYTAFTWSGNLKNVFK